MKKALVLAAAASALVAGMVVSQPATAQIVHRHHHHGFYGGHNGWGWNNPVAFGASAIVGAAVALATAPLWVVAAPFGCDYGDAYGYDYGYAEPIYAPAAVVYAAPRRVVYTHRVAPRRVVYTHRVAPRRVVSQRTLVRTAPRHSVRPVVPR
jgi:hypothetical protein